MKINTSIINKISYGVGIVVAAGGLISAIIGDKDRDKLSEDVENLKKEISQLKGDS